MKRQLLLNGGTGIHLAKNPVMSGWVDSLIEVFPDARIIVMMRDPAQCIPSVLKLVELNWKGKGWTAGEYAKSLDILTDISFKHFTNPRECLARHPNTPQIVVDYTEITTSPRETVLAVYEALGIAVSPEYDAYLQRQQDTERAHKSTFEYSLDDYSLSHERIEIELADFYEAYNWPHGQRHNLEATHG